MWFADVTMVSTIIILVVSVCRRTVSGSAVVTAVFKSPGKNPKKKVDFGKGPQESMAGLAC